MPKKFIVLTIFTWPTLINKYTIIPFEDNLCKINKLSDIDIKNTFEPIVRKYKNDFLQKTILFLVFLYKFLINSLVAKFTFIYLI